MSTPSSTWYANKQPDPHGSTYHCERDKLTLGNFTDDELANGAFMNYNSTPNLQDVIDGRAYLPIVWMTAVKERIRWLSRKLEQAKLQIAVREASEYFEFTVFMQENFPAEDRAWNATSQCFESTFVDNVYIGWKAAKKLHVIPQGEVRDRDVEKDWEFWSDIVAPNGELIPEQVKAELSDYSMVLDGLDSLYMYVTAGRCSKPNTHKSVVKSLHDEYVSDLVDAAVTEALYEVKAEAFASTAHGAVRICPMNDRECGHTANTWCGACPNREAAERAKGFNNEGDPIGGDCGGKQPLAETCKAAKMPDDDTPLENNYE